MQNAYFCLHGGWVGQGKFLCKQNLGNNKKIVKWNIVCHLYNNRCSKNHQILRTLRSTIEPYSTLKNPLDPEEKQENT